MSAGIRVEKLRRDHAIDDFDCGDAALNVFLQRHALQSQQASASQSYVALNGNDLVGYHTLVVSGVNHAQAPDRIVRGLARHRVPVMLLARLAVATEWQGKGFGSALLKDALTRAVVAADIAGIRAFTVHAKNADADAFYRHFNFVSSPTDAMHLFLLLKDVRALLA